MCMQLLEAGRYCVANLAIIHSIMPPTLSAMHNGIDSHLTTFINHE